jgi:geranylgeranyl pyrophosphate synthase
LRRTKKKIIPVGSLGDPQEDICHLADFTSRVRLRALSYFSRLDLQGATGLLFSGKMFRSQLTKLVGDGLSAHDRLCESVAASVEMVHEASLCHDDIQDSQVYRRGRRTLWKQVGVNQAINVGDLLAALAYRPLLELEGSHSKVLAHHLNQVIGEIIHGQILEQQSLGRVLSRASYERIAILKTGSLLAAGPQMLCLALGQTLIMQPLTEALHHLGLAFQFSNDVNLVSHEGLSLDIRNRTSSLPLVLLAERVETSCGEDRWEQLLNDESTLKDLIKKHSIIAAVSKIIDAHLRLFRNKMKRVNPRVAVNCDLLIHQNFLFSRKGLG